MAGDEFVPRPERGRVYETNTRIRLADVGADGRVRLDAIARALQDVAGDDVADARFAADSAWVIRRCTIRIARRPRYRDDLILATWCSGTGPRWAERRTDIARADGVVVEACALWVLVDARTGRPRELDAEFASHYGEAAGGRRVSQRLRHAAPPAAAESRAWPLRVTDVDVLGHVNNAAYWSPIEELLASLPDAPRVARAELEFRGGLDRTEPVELRWVVEPARLRAWLLVHGEVRASAVVDLAAAPSGANEVS